MNIVFVPELLIHFGPLMLFCRKRLLELALDEMLIGKSESEEIVQFVMLFLELEER